MLICFFYYFLFFFLLEAAKPIAAPVAITTAVAGPVSPETGMVANVCMGASERNAVTDAIG